MKTTFELESHHAALTGSIISIVGKHPKYKPYVSIQMPKFEALTTNNNCLFIKGQRP
jgi:hypothetical protein